MSVPSQQQYSFSLPNKHVGQLNPFLPMMERRGDLEDIKKYGHLRVIATNSDFKAPESALIHAFSDTYDLQTTWIMVDDPEYAQGLLLAGQADILIGKNTENTDLSSTLSFQTEHQGATSWLLRKQNSVLKNALNHHLNRYFLFSNVQQKIQEDLSGLKQRKVLRVAMRADPYNYFLKAGQPTGFEYELLEKFAKKQRLWLDVIISSSDAEMITWLKEGKADLIASRKGQRKEPEFISVSPYFFEKELSRNLFETRWELHQNRFWTMNRQHNGLIKAINNFIRDEYRSESYNVRYQHYYKEKLAEFVQQQAISPYDKLVKKHAAIYEFDWRLIVAQMYRESQFLPEAISPSGARGLMQFMPATAREIGLENINDPEMNIQAGIGYMKKLRDRFIEDVTVNERSWFTLASYNAGFERIKDARRFARKLELDPDKWFGHVEIAMQKLARPENLIHTRFGPCRCAQTVNYVREIRRLFNSYIQLTDPILIASSEIHFFASNDSDSGLDQVRPVH